MHWIEFGFQIFVRLTCVTRCDGKCHAERVHCCQVSCSTFILSLAAILSQWLRFKLHAFHIQYYALKCWRAFYSLSWFEFPNRSIVNVWHVETLTQAKWWQKKYRHRNVIAALHVNKRESARLCTERMQRERGFDVPQESGCVCLWRVSEWHTKLGRFWVAAVCFVPIFFSTSVDFE